MKRCAAAAELSFTVLQNELLLPAALKKIASPLPAALIDFSCPELLSGSLMDIMQPGEEAVKNSCNLYFFGQGQ